MNSDSFKNKIVISVIGDREVGKTSLLNSLIFPEIINNNTYIKTIGCDIRFFTDNENSLVIKFFDFGFFDLQTNVEQIKQFAQISSFIFYIINSNIEKLDYINKFSGLFKQNKIILILNQNSKNNKLSLDSEKIKHIIEKYKIINSYETTCFNRQNINNLKENLITLIKDNIEKKEIKNEEYFNINPELNYKTRIKNQNKISCFS